MSVTRLLLTVFLDAVNERAGGTQQRCTGGKFEAGIVAGVEEAEDDTEKEVKTHEVPEDDVPEEYLDKD